jgi:hypothetical protein
MQQSNFDLLTNLPFIFFAVCFFINFIVFARGGIILLFAKGDQAKIDKGKKIFSIAFTVLFVVLLLLAVFFIISSLLQEGDVFKLSQQASEEYPPSAHLGFFPPAPEFTKIGNYYFTGPWHLDLKTRLTELAVFVMMCKNDNGYDILYISDNTRGTFVSNPKYSCWIENCGKNEKNLYEAILWAPGNKYDAVERANIIKEINEANNPVCKEVENKE